MKGLPLAYSKDMQEDKVPTFDAFDAWSCPAAMTGMVADLEPKPARMAAAAGAGFSTATDLADWLVREARPAVPRRPPRHRRGGEAGRSWAEPICRWPNWALNQGIGADVLVLTPAASSASRVSYGGTAPDQVRSQIKRWKDNSAGIDGRIDFEPRSDQA
jgi:argininosuccinate lyase